MSGLKKLLPLIWLFNFSLPALNALAPIPQINCLACDATGHELCARENHNCARAKPKTPACCSAEKTQTPSCDVVAQPSPNDTTLGHKCPQAPHDFLFAAAARVLPLAHAALEKPAFVRQSQSADYFCLPDFSKLTDRPPSASPSSF